jgi:hypothetical protein
MHSAGHNSPTSTQASAIATLNPVFSIFLIASRPVSEIELTRSQETRKHFLIASFSGFSRHRAARRRKIGDGKRDDAENYCERLQDQDVAACGGLTVCGVGRYNHCFSGGENAP